MKKMTLISSILALFLLMFSCAGPAAKKGVEPENPKWVTTGLSTRHPSEFYITGVGSAEIKYNDTAAAQAAADSKAIAQVAKQIEVVIQQRSSSFEREVSSSTGGTVNQRDIWEKTAAYVKIKVEGVRIENRHHDQANNRIYSLAMLDRMAQGQVISEQISALESNAVALTIEAGKSSKSRQKLHRSVAAYGLAIKKLILALRKNQYLNAIAPQITHRDLSATLSDLQADVTRLMSGFSFEKLAGDNQKGIVGGSLREPLKLRVLYREEPIPSIPIRFVMVKGSGNIDTNALSNDTGLVTTTVSNLGPTGEKINKIRAIVNIYPSDPNIQKELSNVIAPVYAQFTYELPPVEDTRIAVLINEYNLGYQQTDAYLESRVVQSLGNMKLQVVKEIPKNIMFDAYDIGGGPGLSKKLSALSAVADLAVVGEVKSTLLDTSAGSSLIFTRARAVVKIFDLASDTALGTVDMSLKGAGPDRDESGRRSLEKMSSKASRAVENEIKRILFGK